MMFKTGRCVVPGDRDPKPLSGFYSTDGHFIFRSGRDGASTVCGETLTEGFIDLSPNRGLACKRCTAQLERWRRRAPGLMC